MAENITRDREPALDYLKCIALTGLVIGNITTNDHLFQLCCFGVNLLIIVSAMLAARTFTDCRSANQKQFLKDYYVRRFFRLAIPAWIFITFYLLLNVIFNFQTLSSGQIIRSYLFQEGSVGNVWIIYVYLICALLMPLLVNLDWKKKGYILISIACFAVYLIGCHLSGNYFLRIFILYPLIYGMISLIGINFKKFSSVFWTFGGIFLIEIWGVWAAVLFVINDKFIPSGSFYVYPPRIYYLACSLGISLLLLVVFFKFRYSLKPLNKFFAFWSSFSLWFYLWHILLLQIAGKFGLGETASIIFVIVVGLLLVFIQKNVLDILETKGINKKILSIFRG